MLAPRNGHWGAWQPASWELTSCSGGLKTRHRNCDNPSPAHGGRDCVGSNTESIDCNECEYNNGGCEHRCINYYGCYTCACYPGYKASQSDWKECVRKYTMCINFSFFVSWLSVHTKWFLNFPGLFFLKSWPFFSHYFVHALCLQARKLRETTRDDLAIGVGKRKQYIRLRIYSLKGKRITRYAFPIAYWRRAMTRRFMYKWHTFLFFTTECITLSWGWIRAKRCYLGAIWTIKHFYS